METPTLPTIYSRNLSDITYDLLKEKIASKELAPGTRLNLEMIEKQLSVSRTPLKQALDRLALEGLVIIQPRSGTYVSNPSSKDISDSFEVRRILEVHGIGLAAQKASDIDLEVLEKLVRALKDLLDAPNRTISYPQYLTKDYSFHHKILSIAGNKHLLQAFERENVHAQMARIRYQHPEDELDNAQNEHDSILAALKSHDAIAAQREMDAHLRRAYRSLMADIALQENSQE